MNIADMSKKSAFVKIIEQPASKALRFRYECEGRSAGSIPGIHSTPENKTYPTIQIVGYKGPAVVVVSCVTKDQPFRPHPHNLVGKEGCKKGICTQKITSENMMVSFSNLGIQCVKKKDIDEALRAREEIRVDPFRTGFSHRSQPSNIDLNSVRLCFQVFLEGPEAEKFTFQLPPVVSEPIYDKKSMSDLVIYKLSHCCASVAGGQEMILLCEKIAKEDIQIRFFEEVEGQVVWEGFADFQPNQVHKQVAISFRVPSYKTLEVDKSVRIFVQLRRPSDGSTSEPLRFEYLPLDSGEEMLKRKRQKCALESNVHKAIPEHDILNPQRNPTSEIAMASIKREPVVLPHMMMNVGDVVIRNDSFRQSFNPDIIGPRSQAETIRRLSTVNQPLCTDINNLPEQKIFTLQPQLKPNMCIGTTISQPMVNSIPQNVNPGLGTTIVTAIQESGNLLDLDSYQGSIPSFDSADMARFGIYPENVYQENQQANDKELDTATENMTDSFTKLSFLQEFCTN